jgi:predicted secreted hydrolase
LESEQVGWDWFALQFENGNDVMFYRMRRADGAEDPFSSGCWVDVDGRSSYLGAETVRIEVLDYWEDRDGSRYPSRWTVSIPERDAVLEVRPLLADQELRLSIHYWEGAVAVEGTLADKPMRGKGYVELAGYADRPVRR